MPGMMFQLNNIPMFKGVYMIMSVEHKIVQGDITTTFKGVRMKKNSLPYVENPIINFESKGGTGKGVAASGIVGDNETDTSAGEKIYGSADMSENINIGKWEGLDFSELNLTLKRMETKRSDVDDVGYTLGKMFINDEFFCYTMEDQVRPIPPEKKVYGQTAIPEGTYKVTMTYSPHFKRILPLLENVPMFSGIRIHVGNIPKHSLGCILVGDKTNAPNRIGNSKATEKLLVGIINKCKDKDKVSIKVMNTFEQ